MFYRQLGFLAAVLATCASAQPPTMREAHARLLVAASRATSTKRSDATPVAPDAAGALRYDRVVHKSIHNAYSRFEPLLDQLVYHRARSLELDIHVAKAGVAAEPGDWFVYHEDYPLFRETTCTHLSDCLGQLAAFHAAVPEHEVVTLFVDLKDGFAPGHDVADLDRALAAVLGRENVVAPGDLVASCPGATSLRDAVAGRCGFPTLGALRGKFVIATTGGSACQASGRARAYADAPGARLAFAAPNVDAACPVRALDARTDLAFFNMAYSALDQAPEVRRRGLVGRVYGTATTGGIDDPSDFAAARAAGAVHVATDKVNAEQDPWATGHGAAGFPFTCDACDDALRERGALLGLRATSGALDGTADEGVFALERTAGRSTWTTLVSVPSSHVESRANACLVARRSDAPGAASVALCRAFDVGRPTLRIRRSDGDETFAIEAPQLPGLQDEVPAFLRLEVTPQGGGSAVAAYVSANGATWTNVASTELDVPLPLRGIAVASHGDTVKALFAGLARSRGGAMEPVHADALELHTVGAGADGLAFEGLDPGALLGHGVAMR